jgi:Glycosyl transferase family 2
MPQVLTYDWTKNGGQVMKLLCHINDDEDLLQAWLDYYMGVGVSSFHFIVHGAASENTKLFQLTKLYPIFIEDAYDDPFNGKEKRRRIESVLAHWRGQWVLWVDSDEFVEFPYRRLSTTIRVLEFFKANALSAPMVQRLTQDGCLKTPETIPDPFRHFPLCSVDLYRKMGVEALTSKYPLFYCHDSTKISNGGNHNPPNGPSTVLSPLQGVTHHFKWRGPALKKIASRAQSLVAWRHESAGYLAYLQSHDLKVPTTDSFSYSRAELFRRGLLKQATLSDFSACVLRRILDGLPSPCQRAARHWYRTFQRALPKPE